MSIRSRLGDRLFRRAPEVESVVIQKQYNAMHEEYGRFCSMINPASPREWYRRGIVDFPRLQAVEGVVSIGISWATVELLLLTAPIDVQDSHRVWRDIGEFLITFNPGRKTLLFENCTHPIEGKNGIIHHPHVYNQSLCSTALDRIKTGFLDAQASEAAVSMIRCLRMRSDIIRNAAYLDVSHWPAKQ